MAKEIAQLEAALKDLQRAGTLVKERDGRQIWRLESGGKAYRVAFYPRTGFALTRMLRGNPAMREFKGLMELQKASVPAPRAVAMLSGFRIGSILGDAVITESLEPGVTLDQYLNDLELRGEQVPERRKLAEKIRTLVHQMTLAKLRHSDLRLGNLFWGDGEVYLVNGSAVRAGGLRQSDLLLLGESARRFASRTDLLRGWYELTTGGIVPRGDALNARLYSDFERSATRESDPFGILQDENGWRGCFVKHMQFARRHSHASSMTFDHTQWRTAWEDLFARIEADQFDILKRSPAGDVLAGQIVLDGRPIQVVIKRPRKKVWYRRVIAVFRESRAMRTWVKAWQLYIRGIPAEFPLLVMEKVSLGIVTDAVIVFERVQGELLSEMNLDRLDAKSRETLLWRLGATLRKIETLGFGHFDAKATNWIIRTDEKVGLVPILIDVDGVRQQRSPGTGIERLLRAMRQHPQYTPADSLALCRGYAPWSRLVQEEIEPQMNTDEHRSPKH